MKFVKILIFLHKESDLIALENLWNFTRKKEKILRSGACKKLKVNPIHSLPIQTYDLTNITFFSITAIFASTSREI